MIGVLRRSRVVRWLAAPEPAGLLYGAIISAAVLAAVSLHEDQALRVAGATAGVLVVYWMADVYVHAITERFDGDTRGLLRRLREAADYKAGVIRGGLPAIVVYLVSYALGAESSTAAFVALSFSVLLLGGVGYYGARRAGSPNRAAVIEGVGAGLLAVLIVAAKAGLH
ncbi:MAG TPA: hypothetical protein PLP61_05145 [Nocardioides sp.]|uniref:hypothetical protein n=1 Tax=Nocardioides sp. TaxID=35761 RepID=UPI002CE67380|nr:hypothetical protein [Nocardioides sp.]HQR26407.1 hypothetical protein [Nocardioides sp.]